MFQHVETGHRAPYLLHVSATSQAVVHIPRDFRGLLTLSIDLTHTMLAMSPGLSAETTTYSDTGKERKCFVGELTESDAEGVWMGDEVQVEITGTEQPMATPFASMSQRLWVGYTDEGPDSQWAVDRNRAFFASSLQL